MKKFVFRAADQLGQVAVESVPITLQKSSRIVLARGEKFGFLGLFLNTRFLSRQNGGFLSYNSSKIYMLSFNT